MIKTLKNLLKQDKERYTVPRKVQDVIPVRRIWKDGIFQVGSRFSKTYQFTDINYLVASREDKEQMFLAYSELLNSLDSGATTKITINNRRLNRANFEQSILMPISAGMRLRLCCVGCMPVSWTVLDRNSPNRLLNPRSSIPRLWPSIRAIRTIYLMMWWWNGCILRSRSRQPL